jgi:hypothetical protein
VIICVLLYRVQQYIAKSLVQKQKTFSNLDIEREFPLILPITEIAISIGVIHDAAGIVTWENV